MHRQIKSTFEINNIKKKDVAMLHARLGEIAIRHGHPAEAAPMFILSMSLISKAFAPDSIFGKDTNVGCFGGKTLPVRVQRSYGESVAC